MNCKPGDLAISICASLEENIGKIVTVGARALDHPTYGPMWSIDAYSILSGTRFMGGEITSVRGALLLCPDAWLRPITGLPITDDVTEEITA